MVFRFVDILHLNLPYFSDTLLRFVLEQSLYIPSTVPKYEIDISTYVIFISWTNFIYKERKNKWQIM